MCINVSLYFILSSRKVCVGGVRCVSTSLCTLFYHLVRFVLGVRCVCRASARKQHFRFRTLSHVPSHLTIDTPHEVMESKRLASYSSILNLGLYYFSDEKSG